MLFGDALEPLDDDAAEIRARRLADLYLKHYVHAAPFDRDVLVAAFGSCTRPACLERRATLEASVGRLRAATR